MLSGGEKAKIKNIVMAIKGEYPKILEVLDIPKFEKNQNSIDELFERVKAICKRTVFKTKSKHVFQLASYTFDGVRHVLIRNGVEKKLTNRELDLLFLFCEYKNRVVERSFALQRIWHEENYFSARNMDVYITKIRKLFKDDPNVELQNIHGVGYKLVVKE